jgi:hypothetical protein
MRRCNIGAGTGCGATGYRLRITGVILTKEVSEYTIVLAQMLPSSAGQRTGCCGNVIKLSEFAK